MLCKTTKPGGSRPHWPGWRLPLVGHTSRPWSLFATLPEPGPINPGSDAGTLLLQAPAVPGYEEMADACLESGMNGADLSVRPGGHVLPENVERDLPRAAQAFRNAGLNIEMMTSGITDPDDPLTEKDPADWPQSWGSGITGWATTGTIQQSGPG